jgi:hypothetical protein
MEIEGRDRTSQPAQTSSLNIGRLTGLAIVTVVPILSFDTVERMMIPPLVYAACHVLEGPFLTAIFLGEDSS